MSGALRYHLDGQAVDALAFRAAAIDPARSVVVDACAGSGKTTLLVSRIVRALLEGAEPDQVLAVTFTRLAAHEMRTRLDDDLRALALADDSSLLRLLSERYALGGARAEALAGRARGLYEAVLGHPRGPSITTFHQWFRALATIGPLAADLGESAQLQEGGGLLMQQAWQAWLGGLRDPARRALRDDFEALVAAIGSSATRACLESLIEQRTDWAVAVDVGLDAPASALAAAADRAGATYTQRWRTDASAWVDARRPGAGASVADGDSLALACADDAAIRTLFVELARILEQGTDTTRRTAAQLLSLAAHAVLDPEGARRWLAGVRAALCKQGGAPRKAPFTKAMAAALQAAGGESQMAARWEDAAAWVDQAVVRVDEWDDVVHNAALMRCGADLLETVRRLKRAQGVIDFADLETIAWRLLRDPATAAYLQCRLDRRYRHLLFDEFQDTSSLQWRVIADWLQSYAGAGERPSVFVVGDPKQSIYRFRRAEARVFDAAKVLLRDAFDAREASTDTTHRNAPAIVDVLNRCLPPWMPHYRVQATAAHAGPGLFWRLPLIEREATASVANVPFDWLEPRAEDDASLRYREGLAIADAIERARAVLAGQGAPVPYGSIYLLARSRTGFEAYERALRERGLPVLSDRAGGLLRSLEADDLRALVSFVRSPSDDLALAQVLASPLVGLDAAALGWIAARGPAPDPPAPDTPAPDTPALDRSDGGDSTEAASEPAAARAPSGWWPRLRALAAAADPADPAPFPLVEIVDRLATWIDAGARWPVHDMLDAVLAEADAFARYPAAVAPGQREVVLANLNAMLGLALDVDAGRFPSAGRFLRHLRGFDTLEDREGPSEGRSDALDAIRLMTIHGSKGLQADLVVLADAHGRPRADGARLHVDWSPESPRPDHVSFVMGSDREGGSRRDTFERERGLREREDCNLLYVALTRARRGVIVTGTKGQNAPKASWWTVLDGTDPPPIDRSRRHLLDPAARSAPVGCRYTPRPARVRGRTRCTRCTRRPARH
ncbi:MAG: UvrD-helicase domain-containing protein [Burkholderiaceae bacterium]